MVYDERLLSVSGILGAQKYRLVKMSENGKIWPLTSANSVRQGNPKDFLVENDSYYEGLWFETSFDLGSRWRSIL